MLLITVCGKIILITKLQLVIVKHEWQIMTQLKLIDANAQWVKKIRDRESYSLNYETYKKEMQINEEEAKRFSKLSEYETNLTFTSLPYEMKLMDADSILMEKRDRWHKALAKDVYVEEAINVLR